MQIRSTAAKANQVLVSIRGNLEKRENKRIEFHVNKQLSKHKIDEASEHFVLQKGSLKHNNFVYQETEPASEPTGTHEIEQRPHQLANFTCAKVQELYGDWVGVGGGGGGGSGE